MDFDLLKQSLLRTCGSIQELAKVPHDFVLHRTVCCRLAQSYALGLRAVLLHVDRAVASGPESLVHANLVPSLEELHNAMLQGEKFMRDCQYRDGWVKRAVVLALSTEGFDVHLHDLVWCICVIYQAVEQVLQPREDRDHHNYELSEKQPQKNHDIYDQLNLVWTNTANDEDLAHLKDALEFKVAEHELATGTREVSEHRLAKFMLRKLSSGDFEHARADEALPPSLWVDPLEFTIKESIGHGANAVVYEVDWWGETFGQKEFFGVDNESFGREAAIQARLRHPNLVQLICCTAKPAKSKCSLVMELMDEDLRTMINNRQNLSRTSTPLPLLTAVDIMLQIAKGMEYLHSLNIMHRDLKSLNVLVSRQIPSNFSDSCRVRAKIADFGMSKAKYQSSQFSSLHTGTTCWRAPEVFEIRPEDEFQSQPNAKYTNKADVYSFGMVCYEILTGKFPFDDGGKLKDLYQRLINGVRPQLPASCPPYLASYIQRCWHGDPKKRPSFAQISRTLRHLKGILLTSADPSSSFALSGHSCTLIEDKLEEIMGPNWVNSHGEFTLRSMTISFEMSWYKVMERTMIGPALEKQSHVEGGFSDVNTGMLTSSAIEIPTSSKRKGFSPKWLRALFERLLCRQGYEAPGKIEWLFYRAPGHINYSDIDLSAAHPSRRFTFKEISTATKQFREVLGIGGAASVYKGTLTNGQMVAVKMMTGVDQNYNNFAGELEILSRLRHPNLVALLGWCCEKNRLIFVYEFMTHGDLDRLLFGPSPHNLSWAQRHKIVGGLALALQYLHQQPIVHRDVKPSNVLLDADYNAKLADFGLARLFQHQETHVTTVVRGTMGYISPEYVMTLRSGPEGDVYSFGIVVLEVACGRKVVQANSTIMQYVWKLYSEGRLLNAGDHSLELVDTLEQERVRRLLLLGLACTQSHPKDRPKMEDVIGVLLGDVPPPIPLYPPYGMN